MAYVQKNNPIPRTGCGRRRMEQMNNPFKLSKASLNKVSTQLKKASKLHADQASKIDKAASAMKMEKKVIKKSTSIDGEKYRRQIKDVAAKNKAREEALKSRRKNTPMKKISGPCKSAAKRKFKVWPSAYASGWGVRCTKAGGPSKYGGQ
tara:strand:- start:2427 stop:2876 length:450 start_codon:yes stop_codon:yes gene_type:complete